MRNAGAGGVWITVPINESAGGRLFVISAAQSLKMKAATFPLFS